MESTEDYYLDARREIASDIQTLETDISLIQHDEVREYARKLRLEKIVFILDLDKRAMELSRDELGGRED